MGDSAPHKALRVIGTGLVILLPVVLALWFAQLRAKAETIDQLHSFSQLALQKRKWSSGKRIRLGQSQPVSR